MGGAESKRNRSSHIHARRSTVEAEIIAFPHSSHEAIRLAPLDARELQFATVARFRTPGAIGHPRFIRTGVDDAEIAHHGDKIRLVDAIADERQHDAFGSTDEPQRFRIDSSEMSHRSVNYGEASALKLTPCQRREDQFSPALLRDSIREVKDST